ncbi:MAG: plasmid recombination protein [Neptuniibacter sp.]
MEKFSDKYAQGIEEQKAKARIKKAQSQGDRDNRKNTKKSSSSGRGVKTVKVKMGNPPKAILRIQKIKSHGSIAASGNHVQRLTETPNSNPELRHLNSTPVGSGDLLADYKAKLGDIQVRKNNVLLVENMLSVSPKYFDDGNGGIDPKRAKAWERQTTYFAKKEYGDNLVSLTFHYDETTPHAHAHVIPIDKDKNPDGKLNAKKYFGAKHKLSKLQDRYADAMKPLGIERGVKGSKAKHQVVKQYYTAVNSSTNQPTKQLKSSTYRVEKADLSARINPEQFAQEQVNKALEQQKKQLEKQHQAQIRSAAIKAADRDKSVQRSNHMEKTARGYYQSHKRSETLRTLPMGSVAESLGLKWDKYKKQYKNEHHTISINGEKFNDHKAGNRVITSKQLGGGAIDLVMHVEGCSFKEAKSYLGAKFGVERVAGHEAAQVFEQQKKKIEPKELIMPKPEPENLRHVKNYLVNERKLSPEVVDSLIDEGDLYADERKNAVFVAKDLEGNITGAEKVGTSLDERYKGWKGVATGTNHSAGVVLCEGLESQGEPRKIVFVESSIDALSYTQLNPTHAAFSTAGKKNEFVENNKSTLLQLSNHNLACGWDNAADADETYQKHFGDDLVIERVIPDEGKDWNEQLQAEYEREHEAKELHELKHEKELKKEAERARDAESRAENGTKWDKESTENSLMTPKLGGEK